jgi:hypothetical protein
MHPTLVRRAAPALLALLAAASPLAAQKTRFEVVGRAPVTRTRLTGLALVHRGGRDYAYAGTFGDCGGCVGGRVYAWDVTDPAHPALTDSVMLDARVVNAVATNADGTLAVATREGASSRRNGIVVLDLADPAHPKVAGDYWETLLGGAHAVAVDGKYAYVADMGTAELAVLDLSDPREPKEVARYGVPDSPGRFLQDVSVKDGLAYLSYWNDGLVVLDVGNGMRQGSPTHPRLVGQFRYQTNWRNFRYGNTAYAFPYTSRAGHRYVLVTDHILASHSDLSRRFETGGFVHVFRVDNVESPVEVARYTATGSGVHALTVENDTMYAAAWGGGVRAVDLSGDLRGELHGRELASYETQDAVAGVPNVPFAWAAVPHGGLVYVTDFNSGLWILRLVPGAGGAQ